jgi:thiosulfate dehydrogenase
LQECWQSNFLGQVPDAMFKGLIIGFLLCLVLMFGGVYLYFATGHAPVAVTDPMMPMERKFAHMALDARIDKDVAKLQAPIAADEKNYLAGADVYKDHCAVCHGVPGREKTGIASGMFPAPPQLFKGTGVTDDPPAETYWKAKNGIRLTGMPGFKDHLNDTELWQVALLLANADKIPDSVKQSLAAAPAEH